MRFLWSSAFLRTIVLIFSLAQFILPGITFALVVTAAIGSGSYFAVIHQFLARGSTLGWVAALIGAALAALAARGLSRWLVLRSV